MDKILIELKRAAVILQMGIDRIGTLDRLEKIKNIENKIREKVFADETAKEEDIMYYESSLNDFKWLDEGIYFVRTFKELKIKKGRTCKKYFLTPSGKWKVKVRSKNSPVHCYAAFKNRYEMLDHLIRLKGWEVVM